MIVFQHSFTGQAVYHSFPKVLIFLLVSSCLDVVVTQPSGWSAQRRGVRESPGALSSQRWKMFWASPRNIMIDSSCLILLCFTLLSSVSAQHGAGSTIPALPFSLKNPHTFPWVLHWACWCNSSLTFNFHHYLCLNLCHTCTWAREHVWRTETVPSYRKDSYHHLRAESQVPNKCYFLICQFITQQSWVFSL